MTSSLLRCTCRYRRRRRRPRLHRIRPTDSRSNWTPHEGNKYVSYTSYLNQQNSDVVLESSPGYIYSSRRRATTKATRVSFARYSDLLVQNREFFIPHLHLAPQSRCLSRNFVKTFDADKTRMIGLPYGEITTTTCWAVFIEYRNITDGQTDGFAISISRQSDNKNLAVANRSRVSSAHNTSRAFIGLNITPWPWNLG